MASLDTPRRFKPEPIEISTISSTGRLQNKTNQETRPACSPAPEPTQDTRPPRRFAVEPIETSQRRHGRLAPELFGSDGRQDCKDEASPVGAEHTSSKPARKFAPQLIGTAKRVRRAGDSSPALLPSDRTEATPGALGDELRNSRKERRRLVPVAPYNTPICEASKNPLFLEIKQRAESPLTLQSRSRGSTRSQRSFRVPELEPILSSGSEASNPPSLSTSPSALSDHSFMFKDATQDHETADDRFSNYVLELAARTAEKQLRDQAMAAFPNDDHHEPVHHFIDRDSEESEESSLVDGSSFTEVDWELAAMRQHRETLERQQKAERERKKQLQAQMNRDREHAYDAWHHPACNPNVIGGWQKDGELDRMRKEARPPMLGADITFPRCSSPEPARFDPTQRCRSLRNSTSHSGDQNHAAEQGGLWCTKGTPSQQPTLWSNPPSRPASRGGLWGGCCKETGCAPQTAPTGLMTPRIEIDNPMDAVHQSAAPPAYFPPTPIATPELFHSDASHCTAEPEPALSLEEEFTDDFVTQVYNYLSLGYPSIARNFDEELSKISHIPIDDLRQDGHIAMPRGYIRLGADGNLKETGITEESCIRWRALRLYIREWARQQPDMVGRVDAGMGGLGMGTAARKGSWAI